MTALEVQQSQSAPEAAQAAARTAELAAAKAAAATQVVAAAPPSQATVDLTKLTLGQLRARRNELQDQRSVIANRRQTLAQSFEKATGVNREGIGARLQIMDNNIVNLEADLAVVGKELANKAGTSEPPFGGPSNNPSGRNPDTGGVVISTALMTFLFTMLFMRRYARRRWGRVAGPVPIDSVQNDRLDRIETAVDTIAVEIERVSENQRFMTRLMTETQLGASIAAVRSSTEMAKSAAESVPAGGG